MLVNKELMELMHDLNAADRKMVEEYLATEEGGKKFGPEFGLEAKAIPPDDLAVALAQMDNLSSPSPENQATLDEALSVRRNNSVMDRAGWGLPPLQAGGPPGASAPPNPFPDISPMSPPGIQAPKANLIPPPPPVPNIGPGQPVPMQQGGMSTMPAALNIGSASRGPSLRRPPRPQQGLMGVQPGSMDPNDPRTGYASAPTTGPNMSPYAKFDRGAEDFFQNQIGGPQGLGLMTSMLERIFGKAKNGRGSDYFPGNNRER